LTVAFFRYRFSIVPSSVRFEPCKPRQQLQYSLMMVMMLSLVRPGKESLEVWPDFAGTAVIEGSGLASKILNEREEG
jgi:hypothetical protein